MGDASKRVRVSHEDVLEELLVATQAHSNSLFFFYGAVTTGPFTVRKRYDVAEGTNRILLSHLFKQASLQEPAALALQSGEVSRKEVARAFARAARAANIPYLQRTWMTLRVRSGLCTMPRMKAPRV